MAFVATESSRTYSAPPAIHNVGMSYIWDADLVTAGRTGQWRPLLPTDFTDISLTGVTAVITGGTYTTTQTTITSSQVIVPAGRKSVSVAVQSGTAYINGVPWNAGLVMNAGGYDGRFVSSTEFAVGITGGRAYIVYE